MNIYFAGNPTTHDEEIYIYNNLPYYYRLFKPGNTEVIFKMPKNEERETNLFLDSGAPTLYNKYMRQETKGEFMGTHMKNRKFDDFSFVGSNDFKKYRRKHIKFLKKYHKHFDTYTVLDIINNPELTWEQQQYYEAQGLSPLPVWHFGSHIKWLHHYLDKGYKYIGIGGMVPNSKKVLIPALDRVWRENLVDSKGMPLVKIHGFAATSVPLMVRYPWYSVDSTTWIKIGIYGGILLPPFSKGKADYLGIPMSIAVSTKSGDKSKAGQHITTLPPLKKKLVLDYIKKRGYKLGESEPFKDDEEEVIIKPGLINQRFIRLRFNAEHFINIQNVLPKWPWAFEIMNKGLL